jgi:thiol-disulfide isomerase/thioredoxin
VKTSPLRGALALVFLVVPIARADQQASAVHIPFVEGKPFAETLRHAKADKKPVLIDVVASWCGPCKIMDKTTFSDPAVVEWARNRVIPARFDAEKGEGRRIASRYGVRSFPTVIFVDGDGNEMDRLLGAVGPPEFKLHGEEIVAGKTRLAEAVEKLKKTWSADDASMLVRVFAERNDLKHLRPLALRLVTEDPDLSRPDTLETLTILVALEDNAEKLTPETSDLVETYLPRLGTDPKRSLFSVVLAREQARRGDVEGARATEAQAVKALGPSSANATDLILAVGTAEKNAGKPAAAAATYKRAMATAQTLNSPRSLQAYIQMNLAEVLAMSGNAADARSALASALDKSGEDATALAMASRVQLLLKAPKEALEKARKAVEVSRGEDADAQAALAASLAASGDATGAAEAWKRATEIDPQNEEVKKHLRGGAKKTGSKTS